MEISDQLISSYLDAAHSFADEARVTIEHFVTKGFSISTKTDKSLITDADKKIEQIIRQRIAEMFPTHGVIGEEFPQTNPDSPYQWILDPIDGTEEFVHGLPTFGTIISLEYKSLPIVGLIDHPMLDMRLYASLHSGTYCNQKKIVLSDEEPEADRLRLGISKKTNFIRYGDESHLFSSIIQEYPNLRVFDTCFAYSCTITGALDVMIDYNVRLWDISACQLLCEEAGGAFTWLKQQQTPKGFTTYSALFGKKSSVHKIASQFFSDRPKVTKNS